MFSVIAALMLFIMWVCILYVQHQQLEELRLKRVVIDKRNHPRWRK